MYQSTENESQPHLNPTTFESDTLGKSIQLQADLQLSCVNLNPHRSLPVDFDRKEPFIEFGCLLSGNLHGTCYVDNGKELYFKGSSRQTWCSYNTQAKGTIEYLPGCPIQGVIFYITGRLVKDIISNGTIPTRALSNNHISPDNNTSDLTPSVQHVVNQVMSTQALTCSSTRLILTSKAYELLALLSTQNNPLEHAEDIRLSGVKRACKLIDSQLAEPPSLADIARKSGLCVTTLTEEFRRQFGTTVFGYVRQQRMAQAKRLITQQDKSASEAAWEVGYSSLSSFHRAFQAQYGVTPGSYCKKA